MPTPRLMGKASRVQDSLGMTSEDKRRSRRHITRLDVDLEYPGWSRRVVAKDVSRHGLFVETSEPPRERQLLQASIHIPGSVVHATTFVTRAVRDGMPGVGLQLFALSLAAKDRWERFIFRLSGGDPHELPAPRTADLPSFLLRFPSFEKLVDFQVRVLPSGVVYLQTPVLRPAKTLVAVVLIHPVTEAEMTLFGSVLRTHNRTPRGMEIRLEPITDDDWARFSRFVELGDSHDQIRPYEEPSFDIDEEAAATPPSAPPIVEDAPPVSDQFDWGAVSDHNIVDLGLNLANEATIDLTPIDATTEAHTELPAPIRDGWFETRVTCSACELDSTVRLGDADGQLGDLGRWVPYWSPKEQTLVSVLRLKPKLEREQILARLGESAISKKIPLQFAFEVADLTLAPKSPAGERVHYSEAARAVADALEVIAHEGRAVLTAPCERCRKGYWTARRI